MNISKSAFLCLLINILVISSSLGQTAGNNSFEFLSLSNSARIAALGGNFACIRDNDLSLAITNPSLISSELNNKLAFSYVNNYADINFGYAAYARDFKTIGSFTGSLHFLDYGNFRYATESGDMGGKFNVSDYALNIGWGRILDTVFSIGANLKFLYSDLEAYNSVGLAVDVAGSYFPDRFTCVSLLLRNVGRQLTSYTSNGVAPIPFEIQMGISRRLEHVPFRFSLLLQHLEKWDLTYDGQDDEIDPFTGQQVSRNKAGDFADKAFRHVIFGGEFIPAKFFSLRMGYNYHRRQELKIDSRPGMVGFSFGIGIHISRMSINYSRAAYHLVGARNYVTLTTSLGNPGK